MSREELLKELQELQLKYFNKCDIEIETRRDKETFMVIFTAFPVSRKLHIYKLRYDSDNTDNLAKIKEELKNIANLYQCDIEILRNN